MITTKDIYKIAPHKNHQMSHYSDIETISSILTNNEFWLTNISNMNDVMEIKWFEKITKEILSSYKDTLSSIHYSLNDLVSNILNHFKNRVFSMSFSLNNDSFHCWEIYHKETPCNICFEYQYLADIIQKNSFTIRNVKENHYEKISCGSFFGPVVYDYSSQVKCVQKFIVDIINAAKKNPLISGNECLKLFEPFVFAFYRSKYFGFEPEQEVRFAVILPQDASKYIDIRKKENIQIEYLKMKMDNQLYPKKIVFKEEAQIKNNLLIKSIPRIIEHSVIESSYLYNCCIRKDF